MHKYLILLSSLILTVSSFAQQNIMLIIADDLGIDAFNGYNVGTLKPTTPHLDSMRNSGILFSNAWSTPVCTPTRAAIMSGKYGVKNGVRTAPGNLDITHTSLMNAIKNENSNYTTGVTGKWHIARPASVQHTIDHGCDHYTGTLISGVADYYDWEKTENGQTSQCYEYVTSYFTDDVNNWIDQQSNPWFMWLAHVTPHSPIQEPPTGTYTINNITPNKRKFMAMIENLDYEIGRMLDSMTTAQKSNTTFIFIGDNGTSGGLLQDFPAGRGKQTLYQGGIHVPMFVCGQGVTRQGETEDALVNVLDIHATVLELVGADLDGGVYNSLSFKHLLDNSNSPEPTRIYNYTELDTNGGDITVQGFTIRDTIYKLIEYHDGTKEFFNLVQDQFELDNLLLDPLSTEDQLHYDDLVLEANIIRNDWSCRDFIKNGDEMDIDCGGTICEACEFAAIDENNSFLKTYPNPTENHLHFESEYKISEISILNTKGQLIRSMEMDNYSGSIDLSEFEQQMLIISFKSIVVQVFKKILIK